MEVLSDLEAALHLTDDGAAPSSTTTTTSSSTTLASSLASNNVSSSSFNSSNLNSNTIVTQAIISSPSRTGSTSAPSDGVYTPSSQLDDVSVIVKQPVSGGDGASSLLNNNNDLSAKDRTHVTAVGTPPI